MENTVIFEGNETFQVPCAVVDHHLQKAPEGALKLLPSSFCIRWETLSAEYRITSEVETFGRSR